MRNIFLLQTINFTILFIILEIAPLTASSDSFCQKALGFFRKTEVVSENEWRKEFARVSALDPSQRLKEIPGTNPPLTTLLAILASFDFNTQILIEKLFLKDPSLQFRVPSYDLISRILQKPKSEVIFLVKLFREVQKKSKPWFSRFIGVLLPNRFVFGRDHEIRIRNQMKDLPQGVTSQDITLARIFRVGFWVFFFYGLPDIAQLGIHSFYGTKIQQANTLGTIIETETAVTQQEHLNSKALRVIDGVEIPKTKSSNQKQFQRQ